MLSCQVHCSKQIARLKHIHMWMIERNLKHLTKKIISQNDDSEILVPVPIKSILFSPTVTKGLENVKFSFL